MASSEESAKILCAVCNKPKGTYKCQGCSQVFCTKHLGDHRNELNKQLEEITMTHDLVHQTLNQHTEDPQKHPTIQEINRWEKKSIDLIRTTAEKLRGKLLEGGTQDATQIKQKLQVLAKELREGREESDFTEIDLKKWTKTLEKLKAELLNPTTITLEEESVSLIKNIRINNQSLQSRSNVFERVCKNAQIHENGRLVIKDDSTDHTEIRGKGEYSTGIHRISFRVERLEKDGWIFFGIISKTQTIQKRSYGSSSSYGWSNKCQIYPSGQYQTKQTLATVENDDVILTVNCDERRIQLMNKRLNSSMELPIDTSKCPFPWQTHLNLFSPNTHVRIVD